jgi:Zn-dependent protease
MASLMARLPRAEFDISRLPPGNGSKLDVHPAFAAAALLATCPFWLGFSLEGVALSAIALVVLVLSLAVHELAHAVLARRYGVTILRVDIGMMGSTTRFGARPIRLSQDLALVYAGPATNLALALVAFLLLLPLLEPHMVKSGCEVVADGYEPIGLAGKAVAFALFANLSLAILNLLPLRRLDGGRITWREIRQRGGRLRADLAAGAQAIALGTSSLMLLVLTVVIALQI